MTSKVGYEKNSGKQFNNRRKTTQTLRCYEICTFVDTIEYKKAKKQKNKQKKQQKKVDVIPLELSVCN